MPRRGIPRYPTRPHTLPMFRISPRGETTQLGIAGLGDLNNKMAVLSLIDAALDSQHLQRSDSKFVDGEWRATITLRARSELYIPVALETFEAVVRGTLIGLDYRRPVRMLDKVRTWAGAAGLLDDDTLCVIDPVRQVLAQQAAAAAKTA